MMLVSINTPDPNLTGDDSSSLFEDLKAQLVGAEALARCRNIEALYLLGQAISVSSTIAQYIAIGYSVLRSQADEILPLVVYNGRQKIEISELDRGMLRCRCGRRFNMTENLLIHVALVGVRLCPSCMLGAVYLQKLEAIRATKP